MNRLVIKKSLSLLPTTRITIIRRGFDAKRTIGNYCRGNNTHSDTTTFPKKVICNNNNDSNNKYSSLAALSPSSSSSSRNNIRFYGDDTSSLTSTSNNERDNKSGWDTIGKYDSLRNRINEIRLSVKTKGESRDGNRGDYSEQATHCLRQLFRLYKDKVNVYDCTQVIGILSNSRNIHSHEKALDILQHMKRVYDEGSGGSNIRPNAVTYATVINAFARKGDIVGSKKVFDMQIHDYEINKNLNAKPRLNSIADMIYNNNNNNLSEMVIDLLTTAIDLHKKGTIDDGPTPALYMRAMHKCARQGDVEGTMSIMEMIEKNVKTKEIPYNKMYGIIINAWRKSGRNDAPQEAKNMLITFSNMFKDGTAHEGPDYITYSSVMAAYAVQGDAEGATDILKMMEDDCSNSVKKKHLKPNVRTYSTLINAWSKSGRDDAPQEAKKLLDKVIDLHSKGDLDEGPNVITYNSVIDSYAVQGDVEGASIILKMLEDDFQAGNLDAKPDMRTYSTFINAISKSGDIDAPKQAEDVLKKMNDLFLKGELDEAPSAITYSSVMDAYAAEGDINGATNILKMMKDAYTSGNKAARPNLRTYNILINTISKSGTENAPQQAEILLTTMIYLFSIKELPDGPNLFSYNTVMDAYAVQGDTDGASDVHEMMKNEHKSGNKNCRPDASSYSILIKAWAMSGKDNTPDEVEKILQEMKELCMSGDLDVINNDTHDILIQTLRKFDGMKVLVEELLPSKNH